MPETLADQIARLEALLTAGATSIESDGETVSVDLEQVRRRLAELRAQQTGQRHRGRRVRTLDISDAF